MFVYVGVHYYKVNYTVCWRYVWFILEKMKSLLGDEVCLESPNANVIKSAPKLTKRP